MTHGSAEPLAHRRFGSGHGLVLAHGAGGSIESNFAPLLDGLAATHSVVAADYPGSGATPRSREPLTLDTLADRLVHTAVSEGVEEFDVVGYSLGTAVAIRAAVRHPQRVTALVLTAGLAHPDGHLALTMDVATSLIDCDDPVSLGRFLLLESSGAAFLATLSQNDRDERARMIAEGTPEGAPEHFDLVRRVDVRADLARISVPTLVIATSQDRLVAPENSRELASGIRDASLMELAAGHNIALERPMEWLDAIRNFLRG
jgi:pimeloyl-ACP methyl ester carboxylesterase